MNQLQNSSIEDLLNELQSRLHDTSDTKHHKDQIKELNDKLNEVNKKLSESEALKSHFISNISNELLNPFTSVLALAENILGVKKENWKKVIQMVSLIHTEVFNLDFQIKNIIAAAKLEAGEITPEITLINIDKLIPNIIDFFKYEARRKHLNIEYLSENNPSGGTIFFKSDVEKIHLIVSNLLSNAIKFSHPEGNITIRAYKDYAELSIQVEDFGQGISKANERIIFDRFKRVDSGINSVNRGHGLGLSIIKALIDQLDGKIKYKSSLGKGTIFTINFIESKDETYGVSTDADEIFFKEDTF